MKRFSVLVSAGFLLSLLTPTSSRFGGFGDSYWDEIGASSHYRQPKRRRDCNYECQSEWDEFQRADLKHAQGRVTEQHGGYTIAVPLPGVRAANISMKADGRSLQLGASRARATPRHRHGQCRCTFHDYGHVREEWTKEYQFPYEIDDGLLDARLTRDGNLVVTVQHPPVKEVARPEPRHETRSAPSSGTADPRTAARRGADRQPTQASHEARPARGGSTTTQASGGGNRDTSSRRAHSQSGNSRRNDHSHPKRASTRDERDDRKADTHSSRKKAVKRRRDVVGVDPRGSDAGGHPWIEEVYDPATSPHAFVPDDDYDASDDYEVVPLEDEELF